VSELHRSVGVLVVKGPKNQGGVSVTKAASRAKASYEPVVSRQEAWEKHQNLSAAFDELIDVLARGGEEREGTTPEDLLLVPRWLCRALHQVLFDSIALSPEVLDQKKGKHKYWLRKYTAKLVHWHRYALVRQSIDAGTHKFPPGSPDVYYAVSAKLKDTAFAGGAGAVKRSYCLVAKAIETNNASEFYVSSHARIYDFLLKLSAVTVPRHGQMIFKDPITDLVITMDYSDVLAGKPTVQFGRPAPIPKQSPGG
jgi:hypothetical protein